MTLFETVEFRECYLPGCLHCKVQYCCSGKAVCIVDQRGCVTKCSWGYSVAVARSDVIAVFVCCFKRRALFGWDVAHLSPVGGEARASFPTQWKSNLRICL